jgi:hypothetical protein
MATHLDYFGGKLDGYLILRDNGQRDQAPFARELWFDRDIDGRWLVGVTQHHPSGAETTGAIVVKDATVRAFIQVLCDLVAAPGDFAGEGLTIGPAWDGQIPSRPMSRRPLSTPPRR